MSLIVWIVLFCLLGGLLSALAAALFLVLNESLRNHALPHLVSFATGTLLGAAFLGLLPHALAALDSSDTHVIPLAVLLGLLVFFLLEKLVLWRHCHTDPCEVHAPEGHGHKRSTGTMVLIGDGLHNFVDGILIAGAFLADVQLGIVTALAIIAHELPQETGDFLVLLHSGYSKSRALFFNLLSSLAMVAGGLLGYLALEGMQELTPYLLGVAASSMIYVAVADLIPGLHKRPELSATLEQVLLIGAGIALIGVVGHASGV